MEKLDLERHKKQLQKERDRLLEEHRAMGAAVEGGNELSDYDNHPADSASDTFERTKDTAIDENWREMIQQIDEALRKIDEGTYGRCDRCSRQISAQRLKAMPFATLCINCQEALERQ